MLIRNFLFHRVSNEADPFWPPMQPFYFERIVKLLTSRYHVVPLEEYLLDPAAYSRNGKKLASVLFDDGYKDNIEYAAPILHKYNCPASFYVVTDCIDKNIPTWTYLLDFALQKTQKSKIFLDFDYVPETLKKIVCGQNAERSVPGIKPWMKQLTNDKRVVVLNTVLEQCDDVDIPGDKMMTWEEVRQLSNQGFIIGSHSHTHPLLASLVDEKEIDDELRVSYAKIVAETGKSPLSISYPIGSFDQRVINTSVAAGYKFGLAVKQTFYKSYPEDLFQIPRVELFQESWLKTMSRISGVYSAVKKVWG